MANELEQIVLSKAQQWLDGDYDEATKAQVKCLMESDMKELTESFYKDMEFGTAGLRGIMGVGTNRMNIYTVGTATQGLANYLKKTFEGEQVRVGVAHDSRNNSRLFAERVADIFASNGFKVYLFDDLRPVPELSFTIRELKLHSGVVITASHNPKEYNGYKAYWGDGAQVTPPHDTNIIMVDEQSVVDGNFPTVESPNPEERKTMSMAIDLAREQGADLVLATDPDADRIGVALRNGKGEYVLLNGNQTLALLLSYQLTRWAERGELDGNQYVVKTIVTSQMANAVAAHFGVKCYDCLTGFKYIAKIIRENEGVAKYIGGGEESFGYLAGDYVRDKDAVSACALAAEAAAWAKDTMGLTLYEWLQQLYVKYGFYRESLVSVVRKGKEGAEEIQRMMVDFRENPPKELAGSEVLTVRDYKSLEEVNLRSGVRTPIEQDSSNVLQWITADGSIISVRPSGTEPKIKFYFGVKEPLPAVEQYDEVLAALDAKIEQIKADLKL